MVTPVYADCSLAAVEHLAKLVQDADLVISSNKAKMEIGFQPMMSDQEVMKNTIQVLQEEQERALVLLQRASHYVYEVLGEFSTQRAAQESAIRRREAAVECVKESMKTFFATQAEVLASELAHFETMLGEEQQRSMHRLKLLYANFCWRRAQRTQKACLNQWWYRFQRRGVDAQNRRHVTEEFDSVSRRIPDDNPWISTARKSSREMKSKEVVPADVMPIGASPPGGSVELQDFSSLPEATTSRMGGDVGCEGCSVVLSAIRKKHARHIQKMRNYYQERWKILRRIARSSSLAVEVERRRARELASECKSVIRCFKEQKNRYDFFLRYYTRKTDLFTSVVVENLLVDSSARRGVEVNPLSNDTLFLCGGDLLHSTERVEETVRSNSMTTDLLTAKNVFLNWLTFTLLSQRRKIVKDRGRGSLPPSTIPRLSLTSSAVSSISESSSESNFTEAPKACVSVSECTATGDCESTLRVAALEWEEVARRGMLYTQRANWNCDILCRQLSYFRESMPGIILERKTLADICVNWETHSHEQLLQRSREIHEQRWKSACIMLKKSNVILLQRWFKQWTLFRAQRRTTDACHKLFAFEVDALMEKNKLSIDFLMTLLEKWKHHTLKVVKIGQAHQNEQSAHQNALRHRWEDSLWRVKEQCTAMNCFSKWHLWAVQKQKRRALFHEKLKSMTLQCESFSRQILEMKAKWVVDSFVAFGALVRNDYQRRTLSYQAERDEFNERLKRLESEECKRLQLESRQRSEILVELKQAKEVGSAAQRRAISLEKCCSEILRWCKTYLNDIVEKGGLHIHLLSVVFTDSVARLPMCRWLSSRRIQYRHEKQHASRLCGGGTQVSTEVERACCTMPSDIGVILSFRCSEEYQDYVELSRISCAALLTEYDLTLLLPTRIDSALLKKIQTTHSQLYPHNIDSVMVSLVSSERLVRFVSSSLLRAFHLDQQKREIWRAAVWSLLSVQHGNRPRSCDVGIQHQHSCARTSTKAHYREQSTQTPVGCVGARRVQGVFSLSPVTSINDGKDGIWQTERLREDQSGESMNGDEEKVCQKNNLSKSKIPETSKKIAFAHLRRACAIVVLQRKALFHVAVINLSNVEAYERLSLASQFECILSEYYAIFSRDRHKIDLLSSEELVTAAESDARQWTFIANKWRQRYVSFHSSVSDELMKHREHRQLELISTAKERGLVEAANTARISHLLEEQIQCTRLLSYSTRLLPWIEFTSSLSTQIQTRKASWFTLSVFQIVTKGDTGSHAEHTHHVECFGEVSLRCLDWYQVQLNALLDLRSSLLTFSMRRFHSGNIHKLQVTKCGSGSGLPCQPDTDRHDNGMWRTEVESRSASMELEYAASERLLQFSSKLSLQEERSNNRLRTTAMLSSQLEHMQKQSDNLFRIVDAALTRSNAMGVDD